jgi:Protein of unknown function (DUF3300)
MGSCLWLMQTVSHPRRKTMSKRQAIAALAAILALNAGSGGAACAQETSQQGEEAVAVVSDALDEPEPSLVSATDIDALMAPVALFPDSVLAQIFMASTYPLDVVKAGRFVQQNEALDGKARADAVAKTDWDPSVQALASGFPDLITRMNDHIEWTEQVGDLVLVQTDDVMDSVQRLRAQAAETGHLTTNDAQTVNVSVDNNISIEPMDPEIVYVPTYNPEVVYSQPAPAEVVYVDSGSGTDWGDVLATGAIIFGTAMILDEIFDDDDPWDDYWRGPSHVDWDNNDFNPRPNIEINGDINIGSNNNVIDRDKVWINDGMIGNVDRSTIDRNVDRKFNPTDAKRDEARAKLAERDELGQRPATLPAATGAGTLAGAAASPEKLRPAKVNNPVKVDRAAKPNVSKEAGAKPANLNRPAKAKPAAKKAPQSTSAFETSGGSRAKAASNRGKSSAKKRNR